MHACELCGSRGDVTCAQGQKHTEFYLRARRIVCALYSLSYYDDGDDRRRLLFCYLLLLCESDGDTASRAVADRFTYQASGTER